LQCFISTFRMHHFNGVMASLCSLY
jgi:hypothetical protein